MFIPRKYVCISVHINVLNIKDRIWATYQHLTNNIQRQNTTWTNLLISPFSVLCIEISISTLILHNWFRVTFSVLTAETQCLTKYSNPLILHWYYLLCWREALWEIITFIGSHHKQRPMWGLSGGFSGTKPCCSDLCFLYHFMRANMCWAALGMVYLRGLAALCSRPETAAPFPEKQVRVLMFSFPCCVQVCTFSQLLYPTYHVKVETINPSHTVKPS